jgi:hypothetical protein
LWESRLPELFVKDYKFTWPQSAIKEDATYLIMDTHSLVEPLLAADKGLRTALAVNQIFVTDADGNVVKTNIME